MITLTYHDETNTLIKFEVLDWDAVETLANRLANAPIELKYLVYADGSDIGVFNLSTFQKG